MGLRAARSRIATWRLQLRVVGRAGEAGDGFGLPRRSARTAEGITTKSPARSGAGLGLRRGLLLCGSGPGGGAGSAAGRGGRRWPVPPDSLWPRGPGTRSCRVRADYIQCASSIGTGACHLHSPRRGRPHSPPSPPCLKAAEAGNRSPDRLRLVPAGPTHDLDSVTESPD